MNNINDDHEMAGLREHREQQSAVSRRVDDGRPLKFRQWDDIAKKFYYWGFIDGEFVLPENHMLNSMEPSEQFTGLRDRNGVEIYEGDVVRVSNYWNGQTSEVVFSGAAFCVEIEDTDIHNEVHEKMVRITDWDVMYSVDETTVEAKYAVEVIGNIHENPELLS